MMKKFKTKLMAGKAYQVGAMSMAMAMALPVPAFAAGESTSVLDGVTAVLSWYLTSMTSITTWLIGNELGSIYLAIFIIGCAVALMFRILHSC